MLELKGIKKKYEENIALHQVSVSIKDGICFGLIGPNGAGKSTLMKIIAGITQKYEGDILFNGKPIEKNRNEVKKAIGYVPQDLVLENTLTARDNLSFFGGIYGIPRSELKEKVDKTLQDIGLADRGDEIVKSYSGGMKRRLNIGCALMHNPKFVIMDEPTVGIDPQSRNYIYSIIERLKNEGKTIIYSSHYMEEVQSLCEEMVLIDNGNILEKGSIHKIIDKHSKPSVYIEGEAVMPEEVQAFGEVKEMGNGYQICSEDVLNTIERVSKYFQSKKKHVSHLEIYHMNLEDIFFKLTGTNLRDE